MIKLTRLHWMWAEEKQDVIHVNPDLIIWMARGVASFQPLGGPKTEIECTDIAFQGYNLKVVEKPEEIAAMISAWRKR